MLTCATTALPSSQALVPLIDNFELAKGQLKPATEGEQKIDAAYQGLYKQMVELFRRQGHPRRGGCCRRRRWGRCCPPACSPACLPACLLACLPARSPC